MVICTYNLRLATHLVIPRNIEKAKYFQIKIVSIRWMTKSIGTLKEVGNAKASKKKVKEKVQLEEIEAGESLSKENLTTSSKKTYILQVTKRIENEMGKA